MLFCRSRFSTGPSVWQRPTATAPSTSTPRNPSCLFPSCRRATPHGWASEWLDQTLIFSDSLWLSCSLTSADMIALKFSGVSKRFIFMSLYSFPGFSVSFRDPQWFYFTDLIGFQITKEHSWLNKWKVTCCWFKNIYILLNIEKKKVWLTYIVNMLI